MKYLISAYTSVLLTISASHVYANEGPSMVELENIILGNANKIFEGGRGEFTQTVSFPEHCLMSTNTVLRKDGNIWHTSETKTPIDLSKLDPSTVERFDLRGYSVSANSTADKFLFDFTRTFYIQPHPDRSLIVYDCNINQCPPIIEQSRPRIGFDGLSSANIRVVEKAFTHLIKLCGGKKQ